MLWEHFVGIVDGAGSDSGDFWVKTGLFSTFLCFSVKPADSERVSKAEKMLVGAGDDSMSSAQLKPDETSDSGKSWAKIGDFSTFWWFFMKWVNSELVSWAVRMEVGAGDHIGGYDLKTARKSALFSCLCEYGMDDELAVEDGVGGCKMTSSGVVGLA